MSKKLFLGTGWAFPVDLGADGRLGYQTEEQKIQESVLVILGTARGERAMRSDFGSRLRDLVFAKIDTSTKSLVSSYVKDALVKWEPRIEIVTISVSDVAATEGKLMIDIEYKVRSTNSRFNLVYPFYLNT